jgi:hypothetical protein
VLAVDLCPDNQLGIHLGLPHDDPGGWSRLTQPAREWRARRREEGLDLLSHGGGGGVGRWLAGIDGYDLVLLDLPLGMAPVIPCRRLLVVNADANCHVRLHRHPWAADERLLVTQFSQPAGPAAGVAGSLAGRGLPLLNLHLHRDEAMAEAMAAKLPVSRCAPTSLVAHELAALATWCLAEGRCPDESAAADAGCGPLVLALSRTARAGSFRPGARIDPGLAAGLGSLPPRASWLAMGAGPCPGALSPADAPRVGDPLRVLLQEPLDDSASPTAHPSALACLARRLWHRGTQTLGHAVPRRRRAGRRRAAREVRWKSVLLCVVAGSLSLLCVTQPFTLQAQRCSSSCWRPWPCSCGPCRAVIPC